VNEEAHSCRILLVLEGKVNEVCTRWDQFDAFEQRPCSPELVVDSELHTFRRFQQEQGAILAHFLVSEVLPSFHD
jgi:hypothetical protein